MSLCSPGNMGRDSSLLLSDWSLVSCFFFGIRLEFLDVKERESFFPFIWRGNAVVKLFAILKLDNFYVYEKEINCKSDVN